MYDYILQAYLYLQYMTNNHWLKLNVCVCVYICVCVCVCVYIYIYNVTLHEKMQGVFEILF